MLFSVWFTFSLAFAGATVSISHGLFPPIGILSPFTSNLVFGGLAGSLLAVGAHLAWKPFSKVLKRERSEQRLVNSILVGLAGTAVGAVLSYGVSLAFPPSPGVGIARGALFVLCGLLGLRAGAVFRKPILQIGKTGEVPDQRSAGARKILDTSIIIDGRIGSLLATGFLEGEILVPEFVLSELQNIADSSNSLRRRKGRRGLDVLNQLMQNERVPIRVITRDYPSIREVDRKLIHLAKDESAVLITTDYNLNRVAQVEGVSILNVNELSNAVKPRFIPGEDISVEIIDRGEEINQGVGYLDDGTMVVVENGRRHIGRTIKAVVKSTLQTDAGRMLFVEPAGEHARWER
jgi:uncharacterized protein YacL